MVEYDLYIREKLREAVESVRLPDVHAPVYDEAAPRPEKQPLARRLLRRPRRAAADLRSPAADPAFR